MGDWSDNDFSGVDWDGNGSIDWYDYEFDREVYQNGGGGSRRPPQKNNESPWGWIFFFIVLIILGILIRPLGALLLLCLYFLGFIAMF